MLVYFHIDEIARDAIVASALKKALRAEGGTLVYGNRFCMRLLQYLNVFDAVILPTIDLYMYCFPDVTRLPDNVVVMPTEAVGQATGRLRRINAKYFGADEQRCEPWHKSVGCYLLWGYAHLTPFREFHPEYLDKCEVVGHPRLAKECISPARSRRGEKPVVGIVSRFSMLNTSDKRSNFSAVYLGMKTPGQVCVMFENSPDCDIEDLLYTEAIDLRILLQVMRAIDHDRFEISIRVHPREDRSQWQHFIKKHGFSASVAEWAEPFSAWLSGVDYVVAPPSTSFYDIFAHGKRPICIRDIVSHRANHVLTESDDNNEIMNYVFQPRSVAEIITAIETETVPYDSAGVEAVLEGQTRSALRMTPLATLCEGWLR